MSKIRIYDPPMCCPTGVCGPGIDPGLARFAADLDWLRRRGVEVERFNLAQQPGAFATSPEVLEAMERLGDAALPMILVEGRAPSHGAYPGRAELAAMMGLEAEAGTDDGAPRGGASSGLLVLGDGPGTSGGCC